VIYTIEVGSGPLRVLLHGGPGASHDYLRPQLDALGGRCFYYDQRGGGRSREAGPGTWQDHVADLVSLRVGLGADKLPLVGYSWGALLAMLYALEHPEHVAKLALIAPASGAARERAEAGARLEAAKKRPEVEALRARLDPSDRRNRFALAVAGWFADPEKALQLTPFLVQQRAEQLVWQSLGDYDLRPRLAKLRVPSLVVHGADDPIPPESARLTAKALGAERHQLPRCGHVPYIEAPQMFPLVTEFLGG
jgi:proline iminopeptidase